MRKADITRDVSQRRFLAQLIRNDVATPCSCESSLATWFPVLRDTANPCRDDEPPFPVLFSFVQRRFIC